MSTSATARNDRREVGKTGFICLLFALLTALFGGVYELFSHGVYSYYMIYAFLVPLAGGTLPYSFLSLSRRVPSPGSAAVCLYNAGLASLTVGSLMRGILDIYGTTNRLVVIYPIAGILFLAAGLVCYGIATWLSSRK